MTEQIAKITSTSLGYEDHGILTVWLNLDYGGSGQGAGGFCLDSYNKETNRREAHKAAGQFIAGVLSACGVETWEKVSGRTVIALRDREGWGDKVVGLKPLPTEPGEQFLFEEVAV